jgi:hypothetical protein
MNHVRESAHNYRVYTNEVSNQLIEGKRPKAKIEDLLLAREAARKANLKAKEEELYGKERKPQITKLAQNVTRPANVYSR